jgi:hypothetical protein
VPVPAANADIVRISAGGFHGLALSSDGVALGWGENSGQQAVAVTQPPTGMSIVDVAGGSRHSVARWQPATSYTRFAAGCAGSSGVSRILPLDMLRLGRVFHATIVQLPVDTALRIAGLSTPPPIDLTQFGMPGCTGFVSTDAVQLVSGNNHMAGFELAIPSTPSLAGLRLHHQALALDPGVNAAGAVASDASTAQIGR